MDLGPTYLVEPQFFYAAAPNKSAEEKVEMFGCISKSGQIFAEYDHHVRTDLLGLADQLEFA